MFFSHFLRRKVPPTQKPCSPCPYTSPRLFSSPSLLCLSVLFCSVLVLSSWSRNTNSSHSFPGIIIDFFCSAYCWQSFRLLPPNPSGYLRFFLPKDHFLYGRNSVASCYDNIVLTLLSGKIKWKLSPAFSHLSKCEGRLHSKEIIISSSSGSSCVPSLKLKLWKVIPSRLTFCPS